jgi:hypothetical protein
MRSDPRVGLPISLVIAGAAAPWLLGQWFASDALFDVFGNGAHAITFLSIFVVLAGGAVALLFRRYARVKAGLLAGRDVIARWAVDAGSFNSFGAVAEARDRAEKRSALYLVFFFVVLIFGAFAAYDTETAPQMLAAGAALGVVVTIAFWLGNRIRKSHLEMRSGEIIVGTKGLLINDVLHVWSTPLSWLSEIEIEEGPPQALTITYGYVTRYGPQYVSVMLPVPPGRMDLAREVELRLRNIKRKYKERQAAPPTPQADRQRR